MDQKLEPHLQRKLEKNLMNGFIKQTMDMQVNLSYDCFDQCVHQFPSKLLNKEETACIQHCAERFLAFTERASKRFQENQVKMNQEFKAEKAKKAQELENKS